MKPTIEIDAVDVVRRIRDAQAAQLADKSTTEVMDFFNRAGARVRKSGSRTQGGSSTRKAANETPKPRAQNRRRR